MKKFPDGEYDLTFDFQIDINRIESVINGLNKKSLSGNNSLHQAFFTKTEKPVFPDDQMIMDKDVQDFCRFLDRPG